MLKVLGLNSLAELIDQAVPAAIRLPNPLKLPDPQSEYAAIAQLKSIASKNQVTRSYLGMGYYDTITPPLFCVIFSKIPVGTQPILPIKPKLPRVASKPC